MLCLPFRAFLQRWDICHGPASSVGFGGSWGAGSLSASNGDGDIHYVINFWLRLVGDNIADEVTITRSPRDWWTSLQKDMRACISKTKMTDELDLNDVPCL
jgi:hypothetical protein